MHGFTIFFMYLNNKNILEYAQILVTSGRFMIYHIEGHSNVLASCQRCVYKQDPFKLEKVLLKFESRVGLHPFLIAVWSSIKRGFVG